MSIFISEYERQIRAQETLAQQRQNPFGLLGPTAQQPILAGPETQPPNKQQEPEFNLILLTGEDDEA